MKKRGLKPPPTYPGVVQSDSRHMGSDVPATPKGKYPTLVRGDVRPSKRPDPFFNGPPGTHGK